MANPFDNADVRQALDNAQEQKPQVAAQGGPTAYRQNPTNANQFKLTFKNQADRDAFVQQARDKNEYTTQPTRGKLSLYIDVPNQALEHFMQTYLLNQKASAQMNANESDSLSLPVIARTVTVTQQQDENTAAIHQQRSKQTQVGATSTQRSGYGAWMNTLPKPEKYKLTQITKMTAMRATPDGLEIRHTFEHKDPQKAAAQAKHTAEQLAKKYHGTAKQEQNGNWTVELSPDSLQQYFRDQQCDEIFQQQVRQDSYDEAERQSEAAQSQRGEVQQKAHAHASADDSASADTAANAAVSASDSEPDDAAMGTRP